MGIPCGIGIGATKTLAKLANHIAKTAERKPSSYPAHLAQVANLAAMTSLELEAVLAATEVGEVWGVGRRIGQQLKDAGIHTVLDLTRLDPAMVRSRWSVILERTVRELQGTPCIELDQAPASKQEIACTRSFGNPVTDLHHLAEAVTDFASRAAVKVRKQGSLAGQVLVFVRTSPFRQEPQYSRFITVPLRRPSSDTGILVNSALSGLERIFLPGFNYAKAGVMLLELRPDSQQQTELALALDDDEQVDSERGRLMTSLDELNGRFGQWTVLMGSAGLAGEQWALSMRQERRTPAYTTCWEDMPVAWA